MVPDLLVRYGRPETITGLDCGVRAASANARMCKTIGQFATL